MSLETSPSGKYKLTIESIETKPGCWNYTHGTVKRGDEVLVIVKRNYSSFPFLWIENHINGHDYLVCGENYQGQTVIELDTGKRKDHLPPEAKQGHGFCWVDYKFDRDHQLLVVSGCYWACPYEWRFYDFSDPMNGWPQLGEDICIESSDKDPVITFDGLITCYETRDLLADDMTSEEEDIKVVATRTFKRDAMKLVEVDSWIDSVEKVRRAEHEAANKKWEEEWAEYKRTDLLYLRMMDRCKEFEDGYISVGITYDGWHPDVKYDDGRVCKRLVWDKKGKGLCIDLEWGRKTAPVKLIIWRDGKEKSIHWFPHSVDGMNAALDKAKAEL